MIERPQTRQEARRIRQERHRQSRMADFAERLGPWGVVLAWVEEAKAVAKAQEKKGNNAAVAELARTLENFCQRYGR
ncbi:hypothetical protein ACWDBD_36665 [Streptomyces sp. NPDC001118]